MKPAVEEVSLEERGGPRTASGGRIRGPQHPPHMLRRPSRETVGDQKQWLYWHTLQMSVYTE